MWRKREQYPADDARSGRIDEATIAGLAGGYGNIGASRFDDMTHFSSGYGTPGWQRAQRRKDTDIPYLSHLLAVASLVLEHEGSETRAIAALRSAGVTQMIHGHTHRPAQHRLEIDERDPLVDGEPLEARLFTAIVARDGRLNIASYDNDF